MILHDDDAITGAAKDYIGNARRGVIEKMIKQEALAQEKMNEVLATLGEKSTAEIEKLLEDCGRLEETHKNLTRRIALLTPRSLRKYKRIM